MKFGMIMHIGPLHWIDFLKIQEGGSRRLENHKNCDISAVV